MSHQFNDLNKDRRISPPAKLPVQHVASTVGRVQIPIQTDTFERITIPSLDVDSSHDSMSDSSPHTDVLDDEILINSHSDAIVPRLKRSAEPQVFIAGSPTDQVNFFPMSPLDSPNPSSNFKSFSVPWGLSNLLSESNAVSYFFKKHVILPRHSDSQRGFLEVLKEMYDEARPSSLLHDAIRAVALGTLSNACQSRPMRVEARKIYGNALQDLGTAIQSPSPANWDELLMTILLFALYEVL